MGDIIFLLDNSGSISAGNFTRVKRFVKDLVSKFEIGKDRVQIGVTTFESAVREEFALNSHETKADVHTAIDQIRYVGGGTNTGGAIRYARETGFAYEKGMSYL